MDCIWNSLESIHLQTERPAKCWNSCGDRHESWRPCKKIYEKFTFFCVGPRAYYLCEPFRLKFTFHIIKRFTKNLPSLNIDRNMPYCEQKSSITFYSNAFAFVLRKKSVFFLHLLVFCTAEQNDPNVDRHHLVLISVDHIGFILHSISIRNINGVLKQN